MLCLNDYMNILSGGKYKKILIMKVIKFYFRHINDRPRAYGTIESAS